MSDSSNSVKPPQKENEQNLPGFPQVYEDVKIRPSTVDGGPQDNWLPSLLGGASVNNDNIYSKAYAIDQRISDALPYGYRRDKYGSLYRRIALPGGGVQEVDASEDEPVIQRYSYSLARRLLDEQMRNNIRFAKSTTGRRFITPQEYVMFASQFGRLPGGLDAYIPYFGMDAAQQATQRAAAEQMMRINAAATGATIDRQRDEVDLRLMENAARERLARIADWQQIATGSIPPPPPYTAPGFAHSSGEQPIGQAYGTSVGAASVDQLRAALDAIDAAKKSGRISPEAAGEIENGIRSRLGAGG